MTHAENAMGGVEVEGCDSSVWLFYIPVWLLVVLAAATLATVLVVVWRAR